MYMYVYIYIYICLFICSGGRLCTLVCVQVCPGGGSVLAPSARGDLS